MPKLLLGEEGRVSGGRRSVGGGGWRVWGGEEMK